VTVEIWRELGATMRDLRRSAGRSLRDIERDSGIGRGTLSQIETGKARASRKAVDWYDGRLGGNGLLTSMYGEARGAHRHEPTGDPSEPAVQDGDAFDVVACTLPLGAVVAAGTRLQVTWTVANAGEVHWRGRRLARVGTHRAVRLIASEPWVELPDCAAGERAEARVSIAVPELPGTLAAYWQIVDDRGRPCFRPPSLIPLIVTAIPAES
jgi:Ig-like domain-containing protein/helix-turn-helix protein